MAATITSAPPAFRSSFAHSRDVAPVVITSSMSISRMPQKLLSAEKTPWIFAVRPAVDRPIWGRVLLFQKAVEDELDTGFPGNDPCKEERLIESALPQFSHAKGHRHKGVDAG
jgi:hypothetical protein